MGLFYSCRYPTAWLHKFRARGHSCYIFYSALKVLSMKLVPGAYNSEVAPTYTEILCTPRLCSTYMAFFWANPIIRIYASL